MTEASTALPPPEKTTRITQRHYQALCGLALAAIFLVQIQQSSMAMPVTLLANLLVVFIGTVGILYRVRLSPILVLIALAGPQLFEQRQVGIAPGWEARDERLFAITDVLLSIAVLTYLIGQYRLHGLWFGLLTSDKRRATVSPGRSEASLSAAELTGLIFPVPMFAVLAQLAYLMLRRFVVPVENFPRQWQLFLPVAWCVLLGVFLAAYAFRYWRRLQMDRVSAQLILQDTLWQQTRGEQRSVNRWIAWRKRKYK